jgi:vacuolar protein sorting-associated protein 13A/C
MKQLLSLIGSIELIGNPVGLVKHLAVGIYDLFDKPIEGFIKGPIEGGIGIIKGVASLTKNTVSGVSNSGGKIAGSIAGGLSAISLDKNY